MSDLHANFRAEVACYTAAAAGCALAGSADALVAWRAVQGAAMAAILVPVVLLAGWREAEGKRGSIRQYLVLTLISLSMMVGVFAAVAY